MSSSLSKCPACAGIVPVAVITCPHCEGALPRRSSLGKLALGLLGGIGASMTLMACYGAPATGCRFVTDELPDGGCRADVTQPMFDAGSVTGDGGVPADAGASDGGADGGR
jgi:hypothetical protein